MDDILLCISSTCSVLVTLLCSLIFVRISYLYMYVVHVCMGDSMLVHDVHLNMYTCTCTCYICTFMWFTCTWLIVCLYTVHLYMYMVHVYMYMVHWYMYILHLYIYVVHLYMYLLYMYMYVVHMSMGDGMLVHVCGTLVHVSIHMYPCMCLYMHGYTHVFEQAVHRYTWRCVDRFT